ncbi:MAG: hypothetical protein WBN23_13465 [Woeseia sp.]
MLHNSLRLLIAFGFGIALAVYAFQRIADPEPRLQRVREEQAVMAARAILPAYVALGRTLEIVDPLHKNRVAGKVYVYPVAAGWQVSGHYRRSGETRWQPWLMTLDPELALVELSVQDKALQNASSRDSRLVVKSTD